MADSSLSESEQSAPTSMPLSVASQLEMDVPKMAEAPLQELCRDYAGYLSYPDMTEQQVQETFQITELMLNRLDEAGALSDTIRVESSSIRQQMAVLVRECQQLPHLLQLIDQIAVVVATMKKSVGELEVQVQAAEAENTSLSFSRLLSFVSGSSQSQAFQPIDIPNTKQHFDDLRRQRQSLYDDADDF